MTTAKQVGATQRSSQPNACCSPWHCLQSQVDIAQTQTNATQLHLLCIRPHSLVLACTFTARLQILICGANALLPPCGTSSATAILNGLHTTCAIRGQILSSSDIRCGESSYFWLHLHSHPFVAESIALRQFGNSPSLTRLALLVELHRLVQQSLSYVSAPTERD